MSRLRLCIAIGMTILGLLLLIVGLHTWGWDGHVIAMPYKELTGLGGATLGLAAWVWLT